VGEAHEFTRAGKGEKRREPLAAARGKSSGAVSSGYSSLGKQRRVTRVRSAERIKNNLRGSTKHPVTNPTKKTSTPNPAPSHWHA
jgi:hypothetical protein